ncbi:hypothetical protein GOP47_0030571 [Adiantum capillus-veneris]|nr:hypothetical protein GOP47_0030571 [Adiantum capillus-veneris]
MADGDVLAEVPMSSGPSLGEPMDILTGLQLVLKKALAHDGLARGLHEPCVLSTTSMQSLSQVRKSSVNGLGFVKSIPKERPGRLLVALRCCEGLWRRNGGLECCAGVPQKSMNTFNFASWRLITFEAPMLHGCRGN